MIRSWRQRFSSPSQWPFVYDFVWKIYNWNLINLYFKNSSRYSIFSFCHLQSKISLHCLNWTEFCDSGDTVLNKTFAAPQDSKGSKVRNELQQFLSLWIERWEIMQCLSLQSLYIPATKIASFNKAFSKRCESYRELKYHIQNIYNNKL